MARRHSDTQPLGTNSGVVVCPSPERRSAGAPERHRPRGMALVAVMWVMAFLAIALSAFAFSMRTELEAARAFKEQLEAAALAEAGIARAMAEMVNTFTRPDAGQHGLGTYDSGVVPLGRGTYQVRMSDEERKIQVNRASPETLRRLLENTGVKDPRLLDTIVDSILDWRDADDFHHLNGAEEAYYLSLPQAYRPRNGDLETLEELALVRGMTRDILQGSVADPARRAALLAADPEEREFQPGEYLGIQPLLTVRGSGSVNVNTAGLDVLVALGVPSPEAREMVARRAEGNIPNALRHRGLRLTAVSSFFRVESTGGLTGSPITHRITALVRNEGTQDRPRPAILSWREGSE